MDTLLCAVVALATGCGHVAKVELSIDRLEGSFPTIENLGLIAYQFRTFNPGEQPCQAIRDRRGFFSTRPGDQTCGTFSGDPEGNALPLDAGAQADIDALKSALSPNGEVMRHVHIDWQGGAIRGGFFVADGCVTYVYSPAWTSLPETVPGVTVPKALSPDWYLVDDCP
jgi:hypothetical protein